jgi:hypothetical protein
MARTKTTQQPLALQSDINRPPEVTVRRGSDAAKVADRPQLTGDPEFDAVEMRETSRGEAFPPGFTDGMLGG